MLILRGKIRILLLSLVIKKINKDKGSTRHHVKIPNPCADDLAWGARDSASQETTDLPRPLPTLSNPIRYFMLPSKKYTQDYYH